MYRPGKQGAKPDTLTRRSEDLPKEGDECLLYQSQTVLKHENVDPACLPEPAEPAEPAEHAEPMGSVEHKKPAKVGDAQQPILMAPIRTRQSVSFRDEVELQLLPEIQDLTHIAYKTDPVVQSILKALATRQAQHPDITLADCERKGSLLFYQNCLYIPDNNDLKAKLTCLTHDKPTSGHPGRARTYELLAQEYYWLNMYQYVSQWIKNCHTCQRITPSYKAWQGILQPLPVPEHAWQDISIDFVTHLPTSQGFDSILVIVDCLTKIRHLITCQATINTKGVAYLYTQYI